MDKHIRIQSMHPEKFFPIWKGKIISRSDMSLMAEMLKSITYHLKVIATEMAAEKEAVHLQMTERQKEKEERIKYRKNELK